MAACEKIIAVPRSVPYTRLFRRTGQRILTVLAAIAALAIGRTAFALSNVPKVIETSRKGIFPGGNLLVQSKQIGNAVVVEISNAYNTPVTASLAFTLDNLLPVQVPTVLTVPAHGHTLAGTFRLAAPDKRFNYNYVLNWLFGDSAAVSAATLYDLPYTTGQRFRVVQGYYGAFSHANLAAIDWSMPEGTAVLAARDGVVVSYNQDALGNGLTPDFLLLEKANWVILRHLDGTLGCYFHLRQSGVSVTPGQTVKRGQTVGYSGNTGFSSAPHLHFEVRTPIDAVQYRTYPVLFRTTGPGNAGEIPIEGRSYTAP
jgi:murein DD-endopeptidase MepM/ murein hydrolase activator NlpD